jgi:hypothetical protein
MTNVKQNIVNTFFTDKKKRTVMKEDLMNFRGESCQMDFCLLKEND